MKSVLAILWIATGFFAITSSLEGDQNAPPPYGSVDFAPFNTEPFRTEECRFWLELEASDGKKYEYSLRAEGPLLGQGSALCDGFEFILKGEGWSVARAEDRLDIISMTDQKKKTHALTKISMTTEKCPAKQSPVVSASLGIKVVTVQK